MSQQLPEPLKWPYPVKWGSEKTASTDVLILGGGVAGCWAAISAAKKGVKVTLLEKGAIIRSGAGGSGCDHWESAATNPCSKVTPEELTQAMLEDHNFYNNGISHYIECREGYDRLLDMEDMGGKIRDTDDEFKGAEFRDEKTKFLFAYDYENRFTLRVWGTSFKPALYRECRRLGIRLIERTMATALLTERGNQGDRIAGAMGVHARTGEFYIIRARAVVLALSRPTRIWLFSSGLPGISEFRPFQCTGDGHAMSWKAGVAFTMMEKSIRAEWSGDRSYPPYGTGNNHNTWFACSMVDATGKKIPWVNRDGTILETISQRYRPAPNQKFFIKGGGESDFPLYKYRGPDTLPVKELLAQGYELPFYADLPGMPDQERRAIWGLMVGEEGKTKIPILKNYAEGGFDPDKDLLQSYGDGWRSASFLPKERQLFGIPGGLFNDWALKTNLDGLYAAGDQLFASNCHGHAAATGHYAGRHAADYATTISHSTPDTLQVQTEKDRIFSLVKREKGMRWKELNLLISRTMQNHCGEVKSEGVLLAGLDALRDIQKQAASELWAGNPHELMRSLEVLNILTNSEIIIHSCLARQASSKYLHFHRSDYPETDPPEWHKFLIVQFTGSGVTTGIVDLNYYGPLKENYELANRAYMKRELI